MFFFFANWLKLGRDAALVFCDIFKTQVECLTYVAAGGWVPPSPNLPLPSKKVAPVQKLRARAKSQGFPLFAQLQNYPRWQASAVFLFFLSKCQKMT